MREPLAVRLELTEAGAEEQATAVVAVWAVAAIPAANPSARGKLIHRVYDIFCLSYIPGDLCPDTAQEAHFNLPAAIRMEPYHFPVTGCTFPVFGCDCIVRQDENARVFACAKHVSN